jgi:hypothetical protein
MAKSSAYLCCARALPIPFLHAPSTTCLSGELEICVKGCKFSIARHVRTSTTNTDPAKKTNALKYRKDRIDSSKHPTHNPPTIASVALAAKRQSASPQKRQSPRPRNVGSFLVLSAQNSPRLRTQGTHLINGYERNRALAMPNEPAKKARPPGRTVSLAGPRKRSKERRP